MEGAIRKAESTYHTAARYVADSITSEHAPKIVLGALAGLGLYKLATLERLPKERSADMTTDTAPPGAAEGGSFSVESQSALPVGDVCVDQVPALVRVSLLQCTSAVQ